MNFIEKSAIITGEWWERQASRTANFLLDAVSMNIEKRCNHYRLIVACMLSGASQDRPVIVGWSTAPRGQVIEEKSWATPEETGSRPARAGKDRIITHPIGDETGWTTARSLGEVGTTSVHSKPVCLCSDCTFLDEIHRAALKKKIVGGDGWACTRDQPRCVAALDRFHVSAGEPELVEIFLFWSSGK